MRQGFHTGEARARQRCGGDAAKTQEVCGGDAVEWAQASGWRAARDVARQCAAAWAGFPSPGRPAHAAHVGLALHVHGAHGVQDGYHGHAHVGEHGQPHVRDAHGGQRQHE